jgi:hypothetical protein
VVPGLLWWELLGFFVAEDISEHSVLSGYTLICFRGSLPDDSFSSSPSGVYCFVCILASDDDWELIIVNPAFGPVDPRLCSRKPGVAQDDLVVAQVCEEVP